RVADHRALHARRDEEAHDLSCQPLSARVAASADHGHCARRACGRGQARVVPGGATPAVVPRGLGRRRPGQVHAGSLMVRTVRRALALIDAADRRKVAWVTVAGSAGAVIQALVILSLMPFIILLTN